MKIVQVPIYEFKEFDDEKQKEIMFKYIDLIMEITTSYWDELDEDHKYKSIIIEAEEKQTPWFAQSMIFEKFENDLKEELDEFYFFESGVIYGDKEEENENTNHIGPSSGVDDGKLEEDIKT